MLFSDLPLRTDRADPGRDRLRTLDALPGREFDRDRDPGRPRALDRDPGRDPGRDPPSPIVGLARRSQEQTISP